VRRYEKKCKVVALRSHFFVFGRQLFCFSVPEVPFLREKPQFFIFKTARFHAKKPRVSLRALVLLAMVCGALCLQKHRNRFAVCAEMRNFAGGLWKRYS
jgi:hypothetical protein